MINADSIKAGPGPRTAFLRDADPEAIAETLVAFANTEGGIIVIGLNEDGTQSDTAVDAEAMQKAMREADDLYNPPVVVDKWEELTIIVEPDETREADEQKEESDDAQSGEAKEAISEKAAALEATVSAEKIEAAPAESAPKSDEGEKAEEAEAPDTSSEENAEPAKASEKSDDSTSKEKAENGDADKSEPGAEKSEPSKAGEAPKNGATGIDAPRPQTEGEEVHVYAVRIPRSIELHALADGRVLIRSGARNRPLGGQEILRLASAKSTGSFESEVVHGATKEDFSRKMIDEYLAKRAERTKRPYNGKIDDLLLEIGAINPEGKPTVCGILLFSEYPQQWLPQSSVVFAKFVGTTPRGESGLAGYSRREELTGPLSRLIEGSWNLIWSEMAISAVVKGLEREERTEYPQFAVREAIVNAICHRDYRLRGRRIELRMYSDRLEVISPGGLPGFITIENIKDEHFSRNPRIVNGLFQWGYIEELGLGIDRMIEVMEQAGHRPPTFDARPYSFAVTLFNEREKPKPPEWVRNTNHRQARALQYIREQGSITNREYRQLCQGVSAETLRLDLVDMVEKGILIKVGSKKGTHYILK